MVHRLHVLFHLWWFVVLVGFLVLHFRVPVCLVWATRAGRRFSYASWKQVIQPALQKQRSSEYKFMNHWQFQFDPLTNDRSLTRIRLAVLIVSFVAILEKRRQKNLAATRLHTETVNVNIRNTLFSSDNIRRHILDNHALKVAECNSLPEDARDRFFKDRSIFSMNGFSDRQNRNPHQPWNYDENHWKIHRQFVCRLRHQQRQSHSTLFSGFENGLVRIRIFKRLAVWFDCGSVSAGWTSLRVKLALRSSFIVFTQCHWHSKIGCCH